MQPVSANWLNNQKQTLVEESFVEVFYDIADPDALADASASDNGSIYIADTPQIVSGVAKDIVPYATLERNIWLLDGSRKIIPESDYGDTGYVSDILSNETCGFDKTPIIEISFTEVHAPVIPGITITWGDAYNEYAENFRVTAYNGATLVAEKTVIDNKSVVSAVEFDIENYDLIRIEILKWCLPYHRARISNVFIGINRIYTKTDLLEFEHLQEVDPLNAKLPKISVRFGIDNTSDEYNPNNEAGMSKYLMERQEIRTRYGYKLGDSIEWIDGGVFYLSEWEAPQNGISANFEARDLLEFMSSTYMKGVYSSEGVSLYSLATAVFEEANLPLNSDGTVKWVIDDSLKNIYTNAPLPLVSLAECLQMIANAAACVLYADRKGTLHIEPIKTENDKDAGWLTETKSGEAVDFENTYNDKAEVLVSGNSEQVQTVQGKNLFDKSKVVPLALSSTGTIVGGQAQYKGFFFPCKPNTLYSVKRVNPTTNRFVICFTEEIPSQGVSFTNAIPSNISTNQYNNDVVISSTSTETSKYGFVYLSNQGDDVPDIMLCEGVILPYEPFVPDSPSPDYPSPVLSAEGNLLVNGQQVVALPTLRKIGDVADTYNPVTGEYVQRIGKLILTGNEPIVATADNNTVNPDLLSFIIRFIPKIAVFNSPVLCTHFIEVKDPFWYTHRTIENISGYVDTSADFVGSVLKSRLITVDTEGFKAFLAAQYAAGTPVTVYYQLAEPVVTYLDPVTVPTYPWYTKLEQDGVVKGTIEATVKVMSDDYTIDNFNSFKKSEISLTKPLLQVDVTTYSHFVDDVGKELYNGVIPINGTKSIYITYSDPAVNVSANVTNGTLTSATYYTNACLLTITGNGEVSVNITGDILKTSETIITTPSGEEKGEIQRVENPLITTAERALVVGAWVKDYLSNRKILSSEWRADPRLDVMDIIRVKNNYGSSLVRTTSVGFTYNGAFRGTGEGRILSGSLD